MTIRISILNGGGAVGGALAGAPPLVAVPDLIEIDMGEWTGRPAGCWASISPTIRTGAGAPGWTGAGGLRRAQFGEDAAELVVVAGVVDAIDAANPVRPE